MSDTTKLKAPKGMSAISVLGQEYKIIKGYVTVAIEHVEHLVGFGFTGTDGDEIDDQTTDSALPAGVTSNLGVAATTITAPAADATLDPTVTIAPAASADTGTAPVSSTQGGYAINQDAPAADAPAANADPAPVETADAAAPGAADAPAAQ